MTIKKFTDHDLWHEFELLNDLFFAGRIMLNHVGFSKKKLKRCAMGAYFPRNKSILLDKTFQDFPRVCTELLLHEMAHAHLDLQGYQGYPSDGGHGGLFHVEIDRLYKAGAYDGIL